MRVAVKQSRGWPSAAWSWSTRPSSFLGRRLSTSCPWPHRVNLGFSIHLGCCLWFGQVIQALSRSSIAIDAATASIAMTTRQWPEVYDSCHTFLHVARVRKHTDKTRAILACPCVFKTRAILACPCVFWFAQRAKTCDKIWFLGPLPNDYALSRSQQSWHQCWGRDLLPHLLREFLATGLVPQPWHPWSWMKHSVWPVLHDIITYQFIIPAFPCSPNGQKGAAVATLIRLGRPDSNADPDFLTVLKDQCKCPCWLLIISGSGPMESL